jgi:hypothetical protein
MRFSQEITPNVLFDRTISMHREIAVSSPSRGPVQGALLFKQISHVSDS